MTQKTVRKKLKRARKKEETRAEKFTLYTMPDMFDQRVLAQVLNKSEYWAERARWAGEGPDYLKLGGSIRYTREDTLAYVKSCRVNHSGGQK